MAETRQIPGEGASAAAAVAPDDCDVVGLVAGPGEQVRQFKTTAFDDAGVLEAAEHTAPRRRRGRPRKALARTAFDNTPITSDDMAFLRATVQGISPHRAALQFLPGDAHQDGRAARPYLRQLLDRLYDAADRAQTLEPDRQRIFLAELRALRREAADPPPRPAGTATSAPPPGPTAPVRGASGHASVAPRPPAPASHRPSLAAFAARFDPDMFSEEELIEQYLEEYPEAAFHEVPAQAELAAAPHEREEASPALAAPGSETATAAPRKVRHVLSATARLALLDDLAQLVANHPEPGGRLQVWLGEKLAGVMQAKHGLTTLEQLAMFINAHGTTWHQQIPTLGPARAARLARWVDRHAQSIGVPLRRRIIAVLAARAPEDPAALDVPPAHLPALPGGALARPGSEDKVLSYALVPLDNFDWPTHLLGVHGEFRAGASNAYGAADDCEALQAWLAKSVSNKALPTQDVVRRAIERLALWALLERRLPLSSLGSPDLVAFREFLYAPPPHWCGNDRVLRGSEDWRPLRGPLKEAGVRQILVFVRKMYADWHASGYLRLNPAHGLTHHRNQHGQEHQQAKREAAQQARAMTMNVRRSFVREDLEAMARELAEMPAGPPRRRLRAILSLYLDSGLRKSEVELLTLGDPVPVRLANELSEWMQITVIGKGNKSRDIPILRSTLEELEAHYADRRELIAQGMLPAPYGDLPRERTPVLSILRESRRVAGKPGPGMTPADAPRRENPDGRLSGSSIAQLLKDFFRRVGQRNDLVSGQADFTAASTHWLRHTFAHRVIMETDAKLPTIQKLLGHQSLATTGIYLDADMSERVRAVAQLKAVF